jgi:hypothetical protein
MNRPGANEAGGAACDEPQARAGHSGEGRAEGLAAFPSPALTCNTIKVDQLDCPRCGKGPLEVVHSSWHCRFCHYKEGCCG